MRDIWVRFVPEHPVENNDWGDFQTHRRLLGLITVGKFDTQPELNELCRIHESLKVKYTQTLFDSRCILFGGSKRLHRKTAGAANGTEAGSPESLNSTSPSTASSSACDSSSLASDTVEAPAADGAQLADLYTTPSNFKSQAFFYPEHDACADLEAQLNDFVHSLFWILESKRLERSREKVDRIVLLQAPFEKKDFVGLDLDTRNNRKRCMGRITKHLGDLTLQAGLAAESLTLFHTAGETLRAISDSLWQAAASEGLCAASAILLYPGSRREPAASAGLQRNASLPVQSPTKVAAAAAAAANAERLRHGQQQKEMDATVVVVPVPVVPASATMAGTEHGISFCMSLFYLKLMHKAVAIFVSVDLLCDDQHLCRIS